MKKFASILIAFVLTLSATAQTLNVVTGDITYRFPAAQAGDMTYTGGSTLTICGKAFTISDITQMFVDADTVTENVVDVVYNGTTAKVTVAGNVAQYVTPTVSGAHVSIAQTNTADIDGDEISYSLSGTSTDGEFYMSGKYKATIDLRGLTLTNVNPVYSGAALHIQNGKRINISVKKDTENTLTDCAEPTTKLAQKAAIYVKGHAEFKGKGTLNVYGRYKHAIKAGEYVSLKNCTLNVKQASGDGINCNQYFLMESGALAISNVGDDGLQTELDADTDTTAVTTDHEDENTGNIYIIDGTVNVTTTATAAKCIKADGTVNITGGTVTVNAQGDIDLTGTDADGYIDPSYPAGIKTAHFTQSGGTLTIDVNGAAGRGIAADSILTVNEGSTITITNSGATKASSSGTAAALAYFCTAKGMKGQTVLINGGTINVTTSGAASKGIMADEGNMVITGGTIDVKVTGTGTIDYTEADGKGCSALNADGDITISGGTLTLTATSTGGKGIKADGTLTIKETANVTAKASGSNYSSGSYSASAKAVKAGQKTLMANRTANSHKKSDPAYYFTGGIVITGGTVTATATAHEAIESKSTINISGGTVYAQSKDDAMNSASTFTISGGTVCGYSTGNDGLDANGDFYITGGTVYSIASTTPEVGIDANTEQGFSLTLSGGTVASIGGLENGSTLSQSCYQLGSSTSGGGNRPGRPGQQGSQSWTANTWYALYSNGSLVLAFKTPSSGGTALVVSTAGTATMNVSSTNSAITVGDTIWNGMGALSASGGTSVTLNAYSGGNNRW